MDKANTLSIFLTLSLCVSWAIGGGMTNGDTEGTFSRRGDDVSPLVPVVNQLSQKVEQQQADLLALKSRMTEMETVVGFTARFSQARVTHLGLNQPVVFDVVPYNAGGGYNRNTGVFTAPKAGTYMFAMGLQRLASEEDTIIMHIKKGTESLAQVEAGYSKYEHGSMVVTTHLNEGDTITVVPQHGSVVFGGLSTIFTGFRISP